MPGDTTEIWTPGRPRGGKILKAISFGQSGTVESFPSKAIVEDPFTEVAGYGAMIPMPPYNMEQLALLSETHPIHASAIEQKVEDIISTGPKFIPPDGQDDADEAEGEAITKWWGSLFEEFTDIETLQIVWNDYETVGWGALEVVRDKNGIVRRLYHVPGHTLRASVENDKYLQIRNGRMVWFKRWNSGDTQIYAKSGRPANEGTNPDSLANELLVFRKPARRSSWYGIPVYISALGHITMAIAARDYNILFFENAREPRHVFIVSGLDEDVEQMLDDLEKSLVTQHKEPHRNLLLPFVGEAKVDIQALAATNGDGQFSQLMDSCDESILTAHRMPPDRLGIQRRGLLGGNVAAITNRIYKDGVVVHGQQILEDRLNKFCMREYPKFLGTNSDGKTPLSHEMSFEDLDITDEAVDTNITVSQLAADLITLNEGRAKLNLPQHDPFKDMTLSEYLTSLGATNPAVPSAPSPPPPGQLVATQKSSSHLEEALLTRMEQMDEFVLELMNNPAQTEKLANGSI